MKKPIKTKHKLGQIIAQRQLRIRFGKENYDITIQIGKPKHHPEPDLDWYVLYKL
ncbi:hypothetical protein LEP1GSC074_4026 [Leptospira noguchii str. Hook]|uniref:Uncharacterized protein n=1 Tax=Leptospira noguchii serovar Autumnalis str. ZUN142 TaxID=1085540 RepID=M6UBC3_9LEPT|nr:hypothetical protein LEP1GSC041_4219 [Leptospira noguchii str. 2006001870]EMO27594.1 hypothetical protein LEP1GSC170_4580 [Leptospira interrogans serovar Bataviae str. HAI135]EMO41830.1 hypothetical protein LEP1GSC186_1800 [Leptospira noguchii serovar Autumnalis str. ZUN142]EMS82494.1 hypothetical protein LEP1GSC074_4026 [Leptospira noguchii str. Hook]